MGFLKPELPVVDFDEWSRGTWAEKIRPMARHWAEVGFGTPVVLHLFYVVKILLYILGAWLLALATEGVDGFTDVASWWTEPIVFQKVVLYTMLFEVIGLGCGFGPLNNRFLPPMGSILYWLRPNTIRLPPWPDRVPLTKGDNRTPVDVALYAAVLVMLVVALFSNGTGPVPALGTEVGVLPVWQIWAILILLALAGLRDKVIFLAARGEVYASLTVTFLFVGYGVDMIIAAKLVCLVIWMGAATSKLNKHFPFVISTMMSNSPVVRPRALKRLFFERFPDDLRPGRVSRWVAHFSTAVEMLVPLALFFSHGGWPTTIAAFVMVCFHLGILTSIPMGVPLEWNVFMIFCVLSLFVGHAQIGLADLTTPCRSCCSRWWPAPSSPETCSRARCRSCPACATTRGTGTPHCGASSRRRRRRSPKDWCRSPACRRRSWSGSTAARRPHRSTSISAMRSAPSTPTAGRCSRSPIAPWRASEADYVLIDGERICSTAIGWNFGDGHMHNEQLIAAMQKRCHFEPGEVRVDPDRRPAHPPRPRVPPGRRRHRRVRIRLYQCRRHGHAATLGRRRPGPRDVGEGQR